MQAFSSALRDAKFAIRTFTRHGRAYVFATLVLALGVGMSTALFSLVDAVLLRPLPFPEQDSLRVIWKADPKASVDFIELSYPELLDLKDGVEAFESVALMPTTLYGYDRVLEVGASDPIRIDTSRVTADFFETLGVEPALGRDFSAADLKSGAAPVAILTDSTWRQRFDGDRGIIGRQIRLSGAGHTIVGVMGPDVDFPRGTSLWTPLMEYSNRRNWFLQAIARVKAGRSDSEVRAQVDALFARLAQDYPFYSSTQQSVITSMTDYWAGASRPQLLISLAASLLLLAASCVTAANLFLSRGLARTQEIATRASLGASSARLASQLIAESAVVAVGACVMGVGTGWALIELLGAMAPASVPRAAEASLNLAALGFAVVATLIVVLSSALLPTVIAARANVGSLLGEASARLTGGRGRRRAQGLFTAAQSAIAVLLLAGSALLVISVNKMLNAEIGFARDAVTMNLTVRGESYDGDQTDQFFTNLIERLRGSPGVSGVAAILQRPLVGPIGWDATFRSAADASKRYEELPMANFQVVTPGYFDAVGLPLLEGRDFADGDEADSEQVVIVSRSLADRLEHSGETPFGASLKVRGTRRVIGIVSNARYRGVTKTNDDVYVPYLQTLIPVRHLVLRGSRPAGELVALARQEAAKLDPTQPPADIETIEQLVARDTATERFSMTLLLAFGLSALILAAAGVYSVVVESVVGRRREIAIRSALGADRLTLARRLSASTLRFVLIGELVGLVGFAASSRWIAERLYEVAPTDPKVLGTVVVFLMSIAAIAAFWPAWATASEEPRAALQDG